MDRGACWATAHRVAKSQTRLKQLSTHARIYILALLCHVLVAACRIFNCGMWTLSCGIWGLVPSAEIEPRSPALREQSLSHWTTREVPPCSFLCQYHTYAIFNLGLLRQYNGKEVPSSRCILARVYPCQDISLKQKRFYFGKSLNLIFFFFQ